MATLTQQATGLWSRWLRASLLAVAGLSLVIALGAWWMLANTVDRHWLGTVLAFGPRWLLLVPAIVLLLPALIWQRTAAAILLMSGAIIVGPVMDCRVPWSQAFAPVPSALRFRVLSCNVAGWTDLTPLARLIERERPDLIACQEWPAGTPWPLQPSTDWHVVQSGSMLVASRQHLELIETQMAEGEPWRTVALACELHTDEGTYRCVCLHLATPRRGLEAVLRGGLKGIPELQMVNSQRRDESRRASELIGRLGGDIVLGDFNMVQGSALYAEDWFALENTFGRTGWGLGHTKRTQLVGVRIDHVLCGPRLTAAGAWLGPPIGSDHLPLFAELLTTSRSTAD